MLHDKFEKIRSSRPEVEVTNQVIVAQLNGTVFDSTVEQCKGMEDLWGKYNLKQGSTTDKDGAKCEDMTSNVTFASGLSRKMLLNTQLVTLINARPFDLQAFAGLLGMVVLHGSVDDERIESIEIADVAYTVDDDEGKLAHDRKTIMGTKKYFPIMYLAVETANYEALRALVQASVVVEKQSMQTYVLKESAASIDQLLDLGKTYLSRAPWESTSVDRSKLNDELAPAWNADEYKWQVEKSSDNLDPLMLAFQKQDTTAMDIILTESVDVSKRKFLRLQTSMQPWPGSDGQWPASFNYLQGLTDLHICASEHTGAVPSMLFDLQSLERLSLVGSGYTVLPDEITQLASLRVLEVAGLPLSQLPVVKMSAMRQLEAVDCSGVKLASPPPEIVKQGPQAVARYIRDLEAGADQNTDVLLMFIGDGEAGKTSTLMALKNSETNTARPIGVDDRTIGIDISEFQPYQDTPLRFSAWDFGGQAVYAIMQQLFMSRRALYPLLWRVRQSLDISRLDPMIQCDVCRKVLVAPKNQTNLQQHVYRVKGQGLCHAGCVSYESMITSWTERLQFRVPGVTIVLIATHIDCAAPEQVDAQCTAVAEIARRILARQAALENGIRQLRIHNNGESLRINNVSGEGVANLRQQLRAVAEGLDFYGEVMPASYVRLRAKLRQMQHRGDLSSWRTWMTWTDYQALGAQCGIDDEEALNVATRFFHDTGELRYFGEATREVNRAAAERGQTQIREAHKLLAATVFPNPFWIVDVLRGLIRHDHAAALQLIEQDSTLSSKDVKVLRRRVHRLMQRGLLHKSLFPYIWHGIAGMSADEATNDDEYRRLLSLLQALDMLMVKPGDESGCDWVVPGLSAGKHARTIDSKAFEDDSLPFVCRLVYDALPPFFDMMLVAHVMNSGIAQSVDFIEGAAAFRKYGDRALLFAGLGKVHDPRSVFRQDQLDEELLGAVLREDQCHVVIAASSRRLLSQLVKEVGVLEEFFPGLRRLAALFPCYTCRQAKQLKQKKLPVPAGADTSRRGPGIMCHPISNSNTNTTTSCSACVPPDPIDHEKELVEAEQFDLEEQKFIADCAGADDVSCDQYYRKHFELLSTASFSAGDYLKDLIKFGFGEWFSEGGYMKIPYNNGRQCGTPRFYAEVLKLLKEVKRRAGMMTYTVERAQPRLKDEFQPDIDAARQKVEDRVFFISAQQSGADLPSMRTVAKYCAKHIDCLVLAWGMEGEKLTSLCGNLHELLDEDARGRLSGKNMVRKEYVPELMYLLRSIVELLSPFTQRFCKGDDCAINAKSLKLFLKEHELNFDVLFKEFSDLTMNDKDHYLIQAYGEHSTDSYAAQHDLLSQVLALFEAQPVRPEDHEAMERLVQQNEANGAFIAAELPGLNATKLRRHNNLKTCAVDLLNRITSLLIGSSGSSEAEAQRGRDEHSYLDLRVGYVIRANLAASNAELLPRLKALWSELGLNLLTASESEFLSNIAFDTCTDTCAWVESALFACEYLFYPLLPLLDQLGECKNLLENWSKLHMPKSFGETECQGDLSGSDTDSSERLHALLLIFLYVRSLVSRDSELSEIYARLEAQLIECDANEAQLWQFFTPRSSTKLKAGSCSSICALYHENSTILSPLRKSAPEVWDVLSLSSSGFVHEKSQMKDAFPRVAFSAYDASDNAAHAFLKLMVNAVNAAEPVDQQEALEAYELKKAALASQFAHIPYDHSKDDYSQFAARCSESLKFQEVTEELFGSEHGSAFAEYWYDMEYNLRDIQYRELTYLVTACCEEDCNRERVVKVFQRRANEFLEIQKMAKDFKTRKAEAAAELMEQLVVGSRQILAARRECTEAWAAFHQQIKERVGPELQVLVEELGHRQKQVSEGWLAMAQAEVAASKERLRLILGCKNRDTQYLAFRAQAISEPVSALISASKEQAAVAYKKRTQLIDTLKSGEVGDKLVTILAESSAGADVYLQLINVKRDTEIKRIKQVVDLFKQRTDQYARLMQLRRDHGPVWYFGGGVRLHQKEEPVRYFRGGEPVQSAGEAPKWVSDWEKFVNLENAGAVEMSCPAEAEYNKVRGKFSTTTAQPADPCVVYISHSTGSFAVEVARAIKASLVREEIEVCYISSSDSTTEGRKTAISEAKLFICCIDNDYACNEDKKAEYSLAASLQLEVVPVLLPGFPVSNYQAWWPAEMAFLEKHSLFVDLRGISTTDEQQAHTLCKIALVPTVRQLLRDWVPRKDCDILLREQQIVQSRNDVDATATRADTSHSVPSNGADAADDVAPLTQAQTSSGTSATSHHYSGVKGRYIACEECALEGYRRSTFDRFHCRELLESWKVQELERRSAFGANVDNGDLGSASYTVTICPLTVQCSGHGQGQEKHEMKVVDVLATKVQEMAIPCPRCLSKGILPPFCFQREVCLAELEFNRGGSLFCKRCSDTVPLFELLHSEVFVSYNWGAPVCPKCSTSYWDAHKVCWTTNLCPQCQVRHPTNQNKYLNQMLVSELKQRIEEEAGVTCWQDLDRLVGGKDLDKEMESGIQQCEVVVVFLTDAYVKSVNCMKEYLFTTKHGKYVIPVLLQDFQGVEKLQEHKKQDDPCLPEWWPESMSSLSQFQPILLNEEDKVESVLFEVCERIQSRFHRAQRYATAADAVDFLRDYHQWGQVRRAFVSDRTATLARVEVEEHLRQLFQQMDLDADGFLSEDELAAFLDGNSGGGGGADSAVFSREQIAALITEADVDCDGQLSVQEFKSAIFTVLKEEWQRSS